MFRSNIKQVHCSGVAAECIYEEYRSSDIFQDLVNSVTGGPSLVLGRSVIGGPPYVPGRRGREDHLLYQVGGGGGIYSRIL